MIAPELSVVITTWGDETLYTQQCLGKVRKWKDRRYEIIVVTHDETPLHRQFLEFCSKIGLIDSLLLAVSGHGHVRGVNLGFERAKADLVFNLTIDTRVGGELIRSCAGRLASEPRLGLIGWHYDWDPDFEGSLWRDGSDRGGLEWRNSAYP